MKLLCGAGVQSLVKKWFGMRKEGQGEETECSESMFCFLKIFFEVEINGLGGGDPGPGIKGDSLCSPLPG